MSQQTLGETFNEGIGSGGFAAAVGSKGTFIFDPFTVNPEIAVIKSKGPLGQTLKKQGIKLDCTASGTVQVPFDGSDLPIWLEEGDVVTDPDGDEWWVSRASKGRRSGEVHKQEVEFELKLN